MILNVTDARINTPALLIPVAPEMCQPLTDWAHHKSSHVFFRDPTVTNIGYLVCHGDEKGNVCVNEKWYSPNVWLKEAAPRLHELGINTVLTISCYGYNQASYRYEGITMCSLHDFPFEVYICIADEYTIESEVHHAPALMISMGLLTDGKWLRRFKLLFWKLMRKLEAWFPREIQDVQ